MKTRIADNTRIRPMALPPIRAMALPRKTGSFKFSRRRDHIPFTIGVSLRALGTRQPPRAYLRPPRMGAGTFFEWSGTRGVLQAQGHDARTRALDGRRAVAERRGVRSDG